MSATDLVDQWAVDYLKELHERHGGDPMLMLTDAVRQASSYKWALTWISGHSPQVANLQAYASMALGNFDFLEEAEESADPRE